MRKITSLLLTLLMVFALATTAFAASGTNDNSGKIIIDNAVKDQTYTIYQILKLESYDTDENAYSYKATDDWNDFINDADIKDVYVEVNKQGYVTWKKGASVADFAAKAKAYAETNMLANQGSKKAESNTVEFTGLNLGYYLVDSTLGALCSLDATNPTVTIKEKNGTPTLDKQVQEDANNNWGDTNDADINQVVNFKVTINVVDGQPQNYVMHDIMSNGLTFDSTSVKVTVNGQDSSAYKLVTEGLSDGCTFEIQFADPKPNDVIVVTYSAKLNSNAIVVLDGNSNKAKLSYTDTNDTSHDTTWDETKTYTWDLDILKYANGDESKVLKDAQFVLLNKDKTKVATIVNGKLTGWADVPAAGTDGTITWPANTVLTTNDNGKIEIDGLDADTYYLREVKAPTGYNKLADDIEVVITGATKNDDGTLTYTTVVAKVNNQSGTELPSTGGMGTTIFYIFGSILVLGAAVLLVTKKRMSAET